MTEPHPTTAIEETKKRLDSVSCSFCLAKWLQVTIHLQNGQTHSCHHPATHRIPVEELTDNPSALHNTNYKKAQRKMMLDGERPPECGYCWAVEDSGNHYSDRHYKSNDPWAAPYFDEVVKRPWDANINPRYVEVSFGHVCNFKCSYCAPHISSKWMEEIKKHGPYPTSARFNNLEDLVAQDSMPIPEREDNPYVEAFWKWWPELYNSVEVFRITGGEPLLNKNTFKVFDYIKNNPNPKLDFCVNTNMGVPEDIFERFLDDIKEVSSKVYFVTIFTSVDAHGKQAEYIRHGLNYDRFIENCHRLMRAVPNVKLAFMSTFNALSITSYKKFLDDYIALKAQYQEHPFRLGLDIPYLRYPRHQSVQILPAGYIPIVEDIHRYMLPRSAIFAKPETARIARIVDLMKNPGIAESELNTARADFYRFFSEHDRRRGTNFLDVFPEFSFFYEQCRKIAQA